MKVHCQIKVINLERHQFHHKGYYIALPRTRLSMSEPFYTSKKMNFEKRQKKSNFLWPFYTFSLDASQFVGGEGTGCMVSTWCRSSNHQSSLYSTAANLTQLFSLQTRSKYFPLFSFYFSILSSAFSQFFASKYSNVKIFKKSLGLDQMDLNHKLSCNFNSKHDKGKFYMVMASA